MAWVRNITDEEIAQIQAAWLMTRNISECARRSNVPRMTVHRWINAHREELNALVALKAPELALRLESLVETIIEHMFETSTITGTNLKDSAMAAAILIDKAQLLKGEPTTRSETLATEQTTVLSADAKRKLRDLRDQLARDATTPTNGAHG